MADLRPDLAEQWHRERNGALLPSDITVGSNIKVWWLDHGHEWCAAPTTRSKGSRCGVCAGRQIQVGFNDLASRQPVLAAEWHPTKNDPVRPDAVSALSSRRVWWLGKCGHEWESTVRNRNYFGTGCPVCIVGTVTPGVDDLATLHPDVAAEWHPRLNEGASPETTTGRSGRKAWWRCQRGHVCESSVVARVAAAQCFVCSGVRDEWLPDSLGARDASLAGEWHPTKNSDLTPDHVTTGSNQRVWWLGACGHEWQSQVNLRSGPRRAGCAVCHGKQIQVGVNDFASQAPELLPQWHPEKNLPLAPDEVTWQSSRKVWWLGECGHEWNASVTDRVHGRGCAVCRGLQIQVGVSDLASTHPALAEQWHPEKNGSLQPTDVTSGVVRKVWWLGVCGHEWEASIASRAGRGHNCGACSSQRLLVGFNDLATKEPALAAEWHPTKNEDLRPDGVLVSSGHKVWWVGECGHEWEAYIGNRSLHNSGCPECATSAGWGTSLMEQNLRRELARWFTGVRPTGVRMPAQKRRRAGTWQCDIAVDLPDGRIAIIEYDGYVNGATGHSNEPEGLDRRKSDDLRAQGFLLIRVRTGRLLPLHPHDIHLTTAQSHYTRAPAAALMVANRLAELGYPPVPHLLDSLSLSRDGDWTLF